MECPSCQHDNRENRRFCAQCGAALPVTCPACGFGNDPGDRFCGGCGNPVSGGSAAGETAPESRPASFSGAGERRQATIVFSDLAGFTAMGERLDPEEVQAIMERIKREAERIVEARGGIVNQFIGDEVLALFGIPTAREDDPRRAVDSALDLHDLVRTLSAEVDPRIGQPLRMHTGINTGLVVTVDGGADGRAGRFGITGDAVNTAARLVAQAHDDEVLLSPETQRLVARHFDTRAMEPVTLKGKTQPLTPYLVLSRARGHTLSAGNLVGRDRELDEFRAIVEAARTNGAGRTVVLRGEAGIGKSRLVEAFQAIAAVPGFRVHNALVLDFGGGQTRDTLRTLVRSLLELPPQASPEPRMEAVRMALTDRIIEGEDEPFLYDLLELPQPPATAMFFSALSTERRVEGLHKTLENLVRSLSARVPLLITLEDLHWADAGTVHLAGLLAAQAARLPLVPVFTTRPEGDPLGDGWREAHGIDTLTRIDLTPLSQEAAESIAAAFSDIPSPVRDNCLERAAGNPLFLEQLLINVEENLTDSLPVSVQMLVQARMDRLPPGDKGVLQAASVLGQRFPLEALRHLLDGQEQGVERLLENRMLVMDGEECAFGHALIHEGVYESLLRSRRRELHLQAADWFRERDADLHAEHLEYAESPDAPEAYLNAAREHASRYRFDRALHLVQKGVALGGDGALGSVLLSAEGGILQDLGRFTDSLPAYEAALARAGSDAERCRARIGLANGMRVVDRIAEAMEMLDQAQGEAGSAGLPVEQARIHHLRGNLFFPQARVEECLAEHQRALELAREAGSIEMEVRAHGGLGDAYFLAANPGKAIEHFDQCASKAHRHGFGRVEAANRVMLNACGIYHDDTEITYQEGIKQGETAMRLGDLRTAMISFLQAGMGRVEGGDLAEGMRCVQRSLELARELKALRFEPEVLAVVAKIELLKGNREEALNIARKAMALCRETGTEYIGPMVMGVLMLATSDPDERRAIIAEGEALIRKGSHLHNAVTFCHDAGNAAIEARDWDEADRITDLFASAIQGDQHNGFPLISSRLRALAASGRGNREPALREELSELLSLAESLHYRLDGQTLRAALESWSGPAAR